MKFDLKLNIRGQLTLQVLLLVGFLFMFFSVSIYFFSKLYLEKRFYKKLQDRAVTTSSLFFDFQANNIDIRKIVETTEKEYLNEEIISIIDIKRNLFVFSTNVKKEEFHRLMLLTIDNTTSVGTSKLGTYKMAYLKIKDNSGDYWVVVTAVDKIGEEALADLKNILIIMSLVALLFIGFLGWYLANKALAPISDIINQLEQIFPKNISKRIIHTNFDDEIGQMAETINKLLQRAENAVFTQKMFVANISHELKNPLTKIFTQIELLEMKYKNFPEFHAQIVSLREDTLKLNNLTSSLLQLANIFSDENAHPLSEIRIDEVVIDAVSEFKKWNPEKTIHIKLENFPEDENALVIFGNVDALKVVFKNLMDNACKFSSNLEAFLEIAFTPKQIAVSIRNEGKPIPLDEISQIFQPFYRSDSTAKGKSGHGVGLAIVKQIIEIHKGRISVKPYQTGNVFEVLFSTLHSTN
ncbi:sensor histidine kinase [Lacihabitans sp. LS3-19]|uniref:HAMP domain-containing sensor histidine kinase n=1 Tax=Lacihabitans sp. LS3-19 TaxID=2487335 RepID=UPI0020CD4FA4|nr:HAMP domain-containing sensor histidine kinase [Lacihabitans sp. LS3-19]MCP9770786.1 sensor histidine kinase [Lacihabitans sp. LS3-19]